MGAFLSTVAICLGINSVIVIAAAPKALPAPKNFMKEYKANIELAENASNISEKFQLLTNLKNEMQSSRYKISNNEKEYIIRSLNDTEAQINTVKQG
jgi:hypothetical protein